MKELLVLTGPKGEIIAASEWSPDALVSVEPEPAPGQKVERIEVANDYALDLPELYKRLQQQMK